MEWLVAKFQPILLMAARYRLWPGLRDLYDPEDVVNDVWVIALPRIPDLSIRDGRATPVVVKFLATTLIYRVNDLVDKHLKGKPVRQRDGRVDENLLDGLPDETRGVVTRLARRELRNDVTTAIDRLDEKDREIIVLRGIEQLPYREISVVLGRDEKALSVAYSRALKKLRRALPRSVFDELNSD